MGFACQLLMNENMLSIGYFSSLDDFENRLKLAIKKCRDEDRGIFSYRYLNVFIDLVDGDWANEGTSFVIDFDDYSMSHFNRKKPITLGVTNIWNEHLSEEREFLKNSEQYGIDMNPKVEDWANVIL